MVQHGSCLNRLVLLCLPLGLSQFVNTIYIDFSADQFRFAHCLLMLYYGCFGARESSILKRRFSHLSKALASFFSPLLGSYSEAWVKGSLPT
jgi:hypothetical protein